MFEDYKIIDPPREGNWLWEVKEGFQKFSLFNSGIKNVPSKYKNVVYLVNLDIGLSSSLLNKDVFSIMIKMIQLNYPTISVKELKDKNLNFSSLKIPKRQNLTEIEDQYDGKLTLASLKVSIPRDGIMILGVTSYDIWNGTEGNNFVFGSASCLDASGVFSLRRFYLDYLSDGTTEEKIVIMKTVYSVCSTMVHEMGHIFGIKHCTYFNCTMNGTNSSEESQSNPSFDFCSICIRKLHSSLKFDIKTRLKNLSLELPKIFSDTVDITKDIDFFNKRLASINDC
jgi:archaemetzincin